MVLFLLLIVLGVVFLFYKQRLVNLGLGIAIIYLLFYLDINLDVTIILSVFVIVLSFNYLFSKSNKLVLTAVFLLPLLLVGSVVAAPPDTPPGQIPPGLVKFVDEIGSVKNQPSMDLKGTDYAPFDDGKLQAYLSIGENPVDFAACYVSVLYPNMTYFMENQFMFPVDKPYFEGLYYKDFIVPNTTGVYPVNAHCFYNATIIHNHVDHVDYEFTELFKEVKPDIMSVEDALKDLDGVLLVLEGDGVCNNINCSVDFNIPLPVGWDNNLLYDGNLFVTFETDTDNRLYEFYAYSPTSNVTVPLFNHTSPKNTPITAQISIKGDLNGTNLFAQDSNILIGVKAYNWKDKKIYFDQVEIILVYNGSYVHDLRGNDELVVSEGVASIIEVTLEDTPLVTTAALLSMFMLLVALFLIFTRFKVFSGLLFMLWPVLFSEDIYITIILLFLGFLLLYRGFKEIRDKKK